MALSSLALAPLGGGQALSAPVPAERKFLFIYAYGGWDYSFVFAPLFDNSWVDTDPGSTVAEAHGLSYVDAASRPAVREFFEGYGDRACILNGMEVRSITHSVCRRLVFTGTTQSQADDFGSILAGHSSQDLVLPHMVLSGPSYGHEFASQVVRMGPDGQLPSLLDGSCYQGTEPSFAVPDAQLQAVAEAYLRDRAESVVAEDRPGWGGRVGQLHSRSLAQLDQLDQLGVELDFEGEDTAGKIQDALKLFSLGLSRCVTLQHDGLYNIGWDSHATNSLQAEHFELLFQVLNQVMESLDSETGLSGAPLADEVTVVVVSEMGRDPRLNAQAGKHHWTHTSAMVLGAGIQGGQVLGGFDENVASSPVDMGTGEVFSGGTYLLPSHLGATLLALGDVDSVPYLGDAQPIEAMLK
jgi:hypothetical protein